MVFERAPPPASQTLRGSHVVLFWTECPATDLWTERWGQLWKLLVAQEPDEKKKKNSFTGTAVHYDRKNLLEQIQSKVMKIPVAIITGAASGLGAAVSVLLFFWTRERARFRDHFPQSLSQIAKRFYEDGMHVVIIDINEERGKKKAEELQGLFIRADVSEVVCNPFIYVFPLQKPNFSFNLSVSVGSRTR